VPGQKISYVTDAVGSAGNSALIVELARGSDYMFIEAMFLGEDEARAREKRHLTARQAGLLGRQSGAKRVIPFHFSPKYIGREDLLRQEVAEAFEDGNLPGWNPG
jgi:ribonuclease Z